MRTKVSLLRLIQTKQFGDVALGMTPSEVIQYLGPPESESLDRKNLILKYGSLQVFFHENKVHLMAIYFLYKLYFPSSIEWEGWRPGPKTTVKRFQQYLTQIGIPYVVEPCKWDDTAIYMLMDDIKVVFELTDTGTTRLYGLYLSHERNASRAKEVT